MKNIVVSIPKLGLGNHVATYNYRTQSLSVRPDVVIGRAVPKVNRGDRRMDGGHMKSDVVHGLRFAMDGIREGGVR